MQKIWKIILLIILLLSSFTPFHRVWAASSCPQNDPCKDIGNPLEKVSCYTNVVNTCSTERESMTSQVIYLSSRISLTSTKIENIKNKIIELQQDIDNITNKIGELDNSMTTITSMFIDRIKASYKYGEFSYLNLVLSTPHISDLFTRFKYIQTVQAHDRKLLFQIQNSKANYQDQKKLREEKILEQNQAKKQQEKEQATLAVQKKDKEIFLAITQNSEAVYKQNLAAAQREASNIQQAASILSQAGVAKHVNKGDVIGLMGNTGFSTGPHLHFAVYNLKESDLNKFNFDSAYENPFNILASRNLPFEPSSCDDVSPSSRTTKSIGSGSWSWPLNNPTISQCFGHTPYSWRYGTGIHNGVDMWDDGDKAIRAVDEGNAYTYLGGQAKGNGVFIFHNNGKMTLYWHLQ